MSRMFDLTIPIKENGGEPLYLQIYRHIKNEIRKGSLSAGQRLPSTRALAQRLQVSRSTVDFAYGQLLSEGYIEARPYKGHFICEINTLYHPEEISRQRAEEKQKEKTAAYDFSPNSVAIDHFPFATWRRISREVFAGEEGQIFTLGEAKGDLRLRESICSYLYASRGVVCSPDQMIVGAGNDYLLMLLQKILGDGKRVAVENPAYVRPARIFASGGYEVCPVDLDHSGMRVEPLQESGAQIAYITPSHQFPTGIVMPIKRRQDILAWAAEDDGRYIIEDDYDSEFRYKGRPIPSLQASDREGKVIYLGTFSKAVAPAIRVSYMVLPQKLLRCYEENLGFISSTVSRIDQAILYHFIEEGHFERYLNKMRKIYKGKHDLMLECLKPFRTSFAVEGEYTGLHILLRSMRGEDEKELIAAAAAAECRVYGLADYMLAPKEGESPATLVVGYAAMTEKKIIDGCRRLQKAWRI